MYNKANATRAMPTSATSAQRLGLMFLMLDVHYRQLMIK